MAGCDKCGRSGIGLWTHGHGRPCVDLWRHKKRGTTYEIIGDAEVQSAAPIEEGHKLTIYRGEDGKLWARPADEFHDGRFEPVTG